MPSETGDLSAFHQICTLGIEPEIAKQALNANGNNVAAAIEWCFDGSFALETMAAAVNSDGHEAWKHVRRKLHIEKTEVDADHFLTGLRIARLLLNDDQVGLEEYIPAGDLAPTVEDALSFLDDCFENGLTSVLSIGGCAPQAISAAVHNVMLEAVHVAVTGLHNSKFKFVNVIELALRADLDWWTGDFTSRCDSLVPGFAEASLQVTQLVQQLQVVHLALDKTIDLLNSGTEHAVRSVLGLLQFTFENRENLEQELQHRVMAIFFRSVQQVLATSAIVLLDDLIKLLFLLHDDPDQQAHVNHICEDVYSHFCGKTAADAKQINTHAFDAAAEALENLTSKKCRDLYTMWLHMAGICWRSESLEKRLYSLQTINCLAGRKVNSSEFIPGPLFNTTYQMNRNPDCRSFTVMKKCGHDLYDIEYTDEPGKILLSESITFDASVGETVPVRCALSVEDFHQWICKEQIFEQMFGSHLHEQLLANQGCEFVIYMSTNGLLTQQHVEWMVNKVTMMHGSEKRSMYRLVLRAFAALDLDSQVSLLQAVEGLKPNDAAALLTSCQPGWWDKNVSFSAAVASHLQRILWRLIGTCAVGSLQSCTIDELMDVFISAILDCPPTTINTDAQWQLPEVDGSVTEWNSWAAGQLDLPQPAVHVLTCFEEFSTRQDAKAVIGVGDAGSSQTMRLWWIWRCVLVVIVAASAAEATVWVDSALRLLRQLLHTTPTDRWESLTSSLFSAEPSVAVLLLDSLSKLSRISHSDQLNSDVLAQSMIRPRLDFVTYLFECGRAQGKDFRRGLKQGLHPAILSRCVDLLSQLSSEAAQSLLLSWLVDLDVKIGLDGPNQARVLEVLCSAMVSLLIPYSQNLFKCFCHFFIALNLDQGKLGIHKQCNGSLFTVESLSDVYDFELDSIDMVWHLALYWPNSNAETLGSNQPSHVLAYQLLITLYKMMPESQNNRFSNSYSIPLEKIHLQLSQQVAVATDASTASEALDALSASVMWLQLLQGLNSYLVPLQKLPGHDDCSVSSHSEELRLSIDVSHLVKSVDGAVVSYDWRSFDVYPQTSLGCLRSLVSREVGIIAGEDIALQLTNGHYNPQASSTCYSLQGDATTMQQLHLNQNSQIRALIHTPNPQNVSTSMSDTIARHAQECYRTLFCFCGASLFWQSQSGSLEVAWNLLMRLPTLDRVTDELDDPSTVAWSRQVSEWPRADSTQMGWTAVVKTVYTIQVVAAFISPADTLVTSSCEQWMTGFVTSEGLSEICLFLCSVPIVQTFQAHMMMTQALEATVAVLHAICVRSTVAFERSLSDCMQHVCGRQSPSNDPEVFEAPSLLQQLVNCLQQRLTTPTLVTPIVCLDVLGILHLFTTTDKPFYKPLISPLCSLLLPESLDCDFLIHLLGNEVSRHISDRTAHLLLKLCQVAPQQSLNGVLRIIQHTIGNASYNTDRISSCFWLADKFVRLNSVSLEQCKSLVSLLVHKLQDVPPDVSNELVIQQCLELLEAIIQIWPDAAGDTCDQNFVDELWEDFMYAFPSDTNPTRRSKVFDPKTLYCVSRLVVAVQQAIPAGTDTLDNLVTKICNYHVSLPKIVTSTWKELTADSRSQPRDPKLCKHVGLLNQGSTCYQNAVLQQLVMMPDVVDHVLSLNLPEECRAPASIVLQDDEDLSAAADGSTAAGEQGASGHAMYLLWQLQLTWSFCLHSFGQWYDPVPFVDACATALKLAHPVRHQNDASEFFHALLDTLSGALSGTDEAGLLEKSFCGERVSRLTAVIDGEKRFGPEKTDAFTVLELEVKGNMNVQMALADLVKEEYLSEVMWDGHPDPEDSVKETYLKECPPHLALYLKRYSFDLNTLQHTRVNDRFEFDDMLDMSHYMQPQQPNVKRAPCWYRLNGVLIQSGSASAGHYYSVIRDRTTGEWLKADDKSVSSFNPFYMAAECFGDALNSPTGAGRSAYMIFYDREDNFGCDQPYLSASFTHLAPALCKSVTATNKAYLRQVQLCSPAHALQVQAMVRMASNSPPSTPPYLIDEAVRLGVQYFFNIALRIVSTNADSAALDLWPELLRNLALKSNKALEVVVDEIDLKCLLLNCPQPSTRHVVSRAVVSCLHETTPMVLHRGFVHKLLSIIPSLSTSDVNCSEYLNLFDEVLTEYPSSQSIVVEAGGVPEIIKVIMGPDWHSDESNQLLSSNTIPLAQDHIVHLLSIVSMIGSSTSISDQLSIDALRMPGLMKAIVRMHANGHSPRIAQVLENLLLLDNHKPEVIIEPLVQCLSSLAWIQSVEDIIHILTCTDLRYPISTFIDQNCEPWEKVDSCTGPHDHIDAWFRDLDIFIVHQAWPQLRPMLFEMRCRQIKQFEAVGHDVSCFADTSAIEAQLDEDGAGTEATEINGDYEVASTEWMDTQGNRSPTSAADAVAPQQCSDTGATDALMNLTQMGKRVEADKSDEIEQPVNKRLKTNDLDSNFDRARQL